MSVIISPANSPRADSNQIYAVCRFVVALAWPPAKTDAGNPEIERIPQRNEHGQFPAMSQIVHLDFHNRNSKTQNVTTIIETLA